MAKTNTELYKSTTAEKPYHRVRNNIFLALTIMQSVETYRFQNSHHNLTCIICDIVRLTSILSEQASRDGLRKTKYSWKVEIADY